MRRFGALVLLIASVFAWGCDDDGGDPPLPTISIQLLSAPTALLAEVDSFYTYTARITGENVSSVWCRITAPDGRRSPGFELRDDGGTTVLSDTAFASVYSGDIAAGNGTYTRLLNAAELADGLTGTYQFQFVAYVGTGEAASQILSVQIENPTTCEIVSWPSNTTFAECFDPFPMEVRVDKDAADRVDSVWVKLEQENVANPFVNVVHFAPFSGDTIWRAAFDPTAFQCAESTPAASYSLHYMTKTLFGLTDTQTVAVASFTNHLPVLSNSILPDTVYRPTLPDRVDTIRVTVDMDDCELAGELYYYGIRFDRARDNGAWSTHESFFLRDDGVAWDQIAGDGTFTIALTINRVDTLPNNMYYFRFYAVECAAPFDTSTYWLDSMRVIQPSGGGGSIVGGDFGVVKL